MSSRIFVLPILQKLEKLLGPPLFKEAHQRAFHRLHFGARDLGDLAIAVHKACSDLLKFEIASDISVHEDLCKFPGCDDKLGDKIDSIVPVTAELGWGRLISAELSIELREEI
jgi:hypothetical protein